MTTFYFIGGEDHDFSQIGTGNTVDTGQTQARRTANARCALVTNFSASNCWVGTLSAPQSTFWLTARAYPWAQGNGSDLFSFRDASGVKRLSVVGSNPVVLKTTNAVGTVTTVATGTGTVTGGALQKIDVFVRYGTSGAFQIYVNNVLILDYSGNLVTDSATTLVSFGLGAAGTSSSSFNCWWSEVICADTDTRFMSLVTLTPSAAGNTNNWDVGTVGNINEITLDDSTMISSGTVGQVAQYTVGSSGVTGTVPIKAVAISARAAKAAGGPQSAKFNVRTGGADFSSASVALQSTFSRVQGIFSTNPNSGAAWANSDITAAGFNIGMVSDT